MAKCVLTDGSGGWFDSEKAICFKENTRWDGRNYISNATGSQWDHEALYFTKSGNWVLNCWSQWQGSTETYERIDEATAMRWLISQECWGDEGINQLPKNMQERIKESITQAEI